MANSPPSGIVIEYDNASATLVNITQHVQSLGDFDIENITEEVHTFGDLWEEHLPIGLAKLNPIELSGLYDDTAATGPNALFGGQSPLLPTAATRTLKVTWLSGKTSSVETILQSYKRSADRNALTRYTAKLLPFGTVTEA